MDNDTLQNSPRLQRLLIIVLVLVVIGGALWFVLSKMESRGGNSALNNDTPKSEIERERERLLVKLSQAASSTPDLEAEKVRLLSNLEKQASVPTAFDESEKLRILKFLAEYASNTP